jgi:hypothetical protein
MPDLATKLRDLANQRHRDRGHDAVDDALRDAADEIERFHSERSYILGFNDGWEGAQEQQPGDDRPFVPEDRIASLETEVAGLKLYSGEKSNQYVAAMEENKALRKALEPFANSDMAPDIYDDDSCVAGCCDFTCADLRRARLASSEKRGGE